MEDYQIQPQLMRWLMRSYSSESVRRVPNIPVALGSDIGAVRKENQDRAVVLRAQTTPNKFFVVAVLCDGMGGMEAGATCAALATSSFLASCIKNRKIATRERLVAAVTDANNAVYENYHGDGGATLSAFIIDNTGEKLAVNVGDSRIYTSEGKDLEQISVDDTIAGQLEKRENASSLDSKLLQFVGIGPDIEPHILELPNSLELSRILLTSDGAHSLNFDSFNSLITQAAEPEVLLKRLLITSRWCGGSDNATGILFKDIIQLNNNGHDFHSGTVSLWDPYGELQLIGIDRQASMEPQKTDDETESKAPETSEEKHEQQSTKESTKPSKKRGRSSSKETKKKPQLRIDFNDD
ncbi:MAG: protein phosphatase 2C domain-containing protein [Alteromonadaceae bacterium]|nr:protein phosphatase 2C domain-containing protein [Alteromonadaceae bacterium]